MQSAHLRLVTVASAALALPSVSLAQQGRAPDPHWGAAIYPIDHYEWRGSLTFNRFTVYSSTSLNPADPSRGTYNQDVTESAGFNLFNLSHTDTLLSPGDRKLTITTNMALGWASDEPSAFLQNGYIHGLLGQNEVPVLDVDTGFQWSAGAAVNYWFGKHGFYQRDPELRDESHRFSGFIGAGAVASSLYYEPEVHIGGAWDAPRWNLRLSGLYRAGLPIGGETYRDVADISHITQVSLHYVPDNYYMAPSFSDALKWKHIVLPWCWLKGLHDLVGRPEVGVHLTHDTGLFEDVSNNGISTWFISGSFQWSTGLRVEVWNDILNGTDHGPTFGMVVGVDLLTVYDKFFRGT